MMNPEKASLILAVDQSPAINSNVVRPLSQLGHQVITANTVEQAKNILESAVERPSLFIVDVGMKEFMGLEFIQFLKEDVRWNHIPILVQSMSQTIDFYQFCEGVLMKPYSSGDLTRQVGLMLGSSIA
jgi:response regulator RpfG family c-di-GMP phosphodiesterase